MEVQIIEQYMAHQRSQGIENPQSGEPERKAAALVASNPEYILRLATVMAGIVERNKLKSRKGGMK